MSEHDDVAVLLIDDCSSDRTAEVAKADLDEKGFWCPVTVFRNPVNQGYGGNQKLGYRYAIDNAFDVVVLLHGDGQYAPEYLPGMIRPFSQEGAPMPCLARAC